MDNLDESHKMLNKISCDIGRFGDEKRREIQALKKENERLKEYARHQKNCDLSEYQGLSSFNLGGGKCDCGLEELLKRE